MSGVILSQVVHLIPTFSVELRCNGNDFAYCWQGNVPSNNVFRAFDGNDKISAITGHIDWLGNVNSRHCFFLPFLATQIASIRAVSFAQITSALTGLVNKLARVSA